MKKFIDFIKQGWFLSLLGVIVLSVIFYFVAPLIFSESIALIATIAGIALLFIGWMGFQLLGIVLSRKKNEQILDSLQDLDEHQGAADEEVDILKERLSQAISELKNSKMGKSGKSSYLYQLPWYIIIGPPASGKTTLLKNSSLKTALSDKFGRDSIAGIGGTRHCDWWFAEDAVLLDTAGRYTTQDSHSETDKKAWIGFLNLLKKNRTRRPLNGVMIAISMADLLTSNEIHQHATEIRKRLQELYDQFNLKLPVYLVFTKTDMLAGFSEFFDDLDSDARAQVWGTTFTRDNKILKEPLPQLKQELELLEVQLKNKLILKLEKETDLERRKKIYAFPEQFRSVRNSVDSFVNEVFTPSRYQHKIFLRGVYFTSAEQTGSPIDKLLNSMAHTFGFERFNAPSLRAKGKSFFIDHLLQKVIFPESELAGLNPDYEKSRRMLQWGTISIAVFALITGIGLWLTSYLRNNSSIEILSTNFEALQTSAEQNSGSDDIRKSLDILDKASLLFQQDDSVLATFGLSQQQRLADQSSITYNNALQMELLPYIIKTLETELRNNTKDKNRLFKNLKAYLLFKHDDHFKENKGLLKALMESSWKKQYTPEEQQRLGTHLDALLAISPKPALSLAGMDIDADLVKKTQDALAGMNVGQLVYDQVKSDIIRDTNLPEFIFTGSRGAVKNIERVFERKTGNMLEGINGLFTYKGSQAFKEQSPAIVENFLNDKWVFGDGIKADFDTVATEVKHLYLTEYQVTWDDFLLSLKPLTPADLNQAADLLNAIASPPSPLQGLLKAVADETYLSKPLEGVPAGVEERALKEAERQLVQKTGQLGSIASNIAGSNALSSFADKGADDPVSIHFGPLRELAAADNASMQRLLKEMDALSSKLRDSRNSAPQSMLREQQVQLEKSLDNFEAATSNLPTTVKGWSAEIREPIVSLLGSKGSSIQNLLWGTQVYSVYQSKIQGKYPLAGSPGSNDIPLGDFKEFFGPDGILDKYVKENLSNQIDRTQKVWKSANTLTPLTSLKSDALQQLQRAEEIRKAFFPDGKVGIRFSIKPEALPPNIEKITLNIGGSETNFDNQGIPKLANVQWPGQDGAVLVRLDITTNDGTPPITLSSEGQWALIDMFTQQGSFQKTGGSIYQVNLNNIAFKVEVPTSDNLFNAINDLRSFKCPSDLLGGK